VLIPTVQAWQHLHGLRLQPPGLPLRSAFMLVVETDFHDHCS
jgi:hypothetical protein